MALVNRLDAASLAVLPPHEQKIDSEGSFDGNDFEEELQRLSAVNQQLLDEFCHPGGNEPAPSNAEELEKLRQENAELKARVEELEKLRQENAELNACVEELEKLPQENAELKACVDELKALSSGQGEEFWLGRQREYEMLLEEKSEVIRGLHQRIQEAQETVGIGDAPPPLASASGTRLSQEIDRLKRELEEQRRHLEQDQENMMVQMREMEVTMARERAEMARQRQEVQRLQADLAREIELSGRDPELRERLQNLRRRRDDKPTPTPVPVSAPDLAPSKEQKNSGFFRRIFG